MNYKRSPYAYPQTTKKWPQYVASLAAAGGDFALGCGFGWSAPSQIPLTVHQEYFPISANEFYWITSIIHLGCAISCLPIGYLSCKFGRKTTMLYLVIPFTIGWMLIIFATNFVTLLIGRLLIGLAGGAFCISVPQYTAEIAEKEIRGSLGSLVELLIVMGILFSYIVGSFVNVFWLSVVSGSIPLIFGAVFYFMPESPTYLVEKGKNQEAVKALKWLRGQQYDPTREVDDLISDLLDKKDHTISYWEILRRKANIKALIIGLGLMFFTKMSGINIIVFYATSIFDAANASISPDISTIVLGSINAASTLLSTFVVDKLGRKVLLLISLISMIACTFLIGSFFYMRDQDAASMEYIGWLPLASLSVFMVAISLGFGPVPWIMLGEIFSNDLKPIGGSISGAFNWTLAFLLTNTFGLVVDTIGIGQTFWMFAAVSSIGVFFIIFVVPETKSKSLMEIQRMLEK